MTMMLMIFMSLTTWAEVMMTSRIMIIVSKGGGGFLVILKSSNENCADARLV
jgi:hypothetical protein